MSSVWWVILGGFILVLIVCIAVASVWQKKFIYGRQSANGKDNEQMRALARELVHEIRNPLNSMSLNLQLLEEDFSDTQRDRKDLQERVRRIRQEVEHLNRILTDFRRYARLSPLTLEVVDLAMLIEEVLDFNEPEAQRQNIQVIREIQELPLTQLDRAQFKQALLNLVINAHQAMEDGGKLFVRAQAFNGQIQIEVEDTGKGIDAVILDRIFDLFVSTKEDGTGVGLAIVKQVVESHGGSVKVRSQANHNTTFSILLPVKRGVKH
jgi:signal transduction histidine kinase